jgi:hypothetical protein
MRTVLICVAIFLSTSLLAQDSTIKYLFKEIGWSINLPSEFVVLDTSEISLLKNLGTKAIEDASSLKADSPEIVTLISARKNSQNYFEATLTPFSTIKEADYKLATQELNNITYKTMVESIPGGTIDSFSTSTKIAGVTFDNFTISFKIYDKVLFKMVMLSTLYKGYDFGIGYLYSDERTKVRIEGMLANSNFSN